MASLLTLVGCVSMPTASEIRASDPVALQAAVVDGRARFREIYCAEIARSRAGGSDAQCEDLLWRLQDEPSPAAMPAVPATIRKDLRVFVVSGAFGDCRIEDMFPYGVEIDRLNAAGHHIVAVKVSGRSSAAANARQLADAIRAAEVPAGEPIVLVGYSKGAVDILQMLVDHPDVGREVAAVVSVAGPVYGSPLAEKADWWYREVFAKWFSDLCAPGDAGVISSLVPATRRQWMTENPLPPNVRYYSLAAFTTRDHLSRALRTTWRMLADLDRRNDGQVLPADAVIPGGTLLGYVNADHWDVAIALEKQLPLLSMRPVRREFPRGTLFDALLAYVGEALPARAVSTD